MAKVLMIQGTMSGVGKSLLVAALCRIMKQDGYCTAPFKSQNMALNSFVTKDGLEMGRAQVLQAQAAGLEPDADMNPILLKPTGHSVSQVIVQGKALGNMRAKEYFAYKKNLIPVIAESFRRLEAKSDIIVIEGAGSPAEINLKENDIVNMGMAELVDAPVLLVGDIDRGGVFAQLLGTLMLLEEHEKKRVQGLIINKFRGDKGLLDSGIQMLEKRGSLPVVGCIPYMELSLEDEDSQSSRLVPGYQKGSGLVQPEEEKDSIRIAVLRLPHISNYTDLQAFEQNDRVRISYTDRTEDLEGADLIILPGSKNTVADLNWLREKGLDQRIVSLAGKIPVFGICGGFQMLGDKVEDPTGAESGLSARGLGLMHLHTVLLPDKTQRQVKRRIGKVEGIFANLTGLEAEGYEIHLGVTWQERAKEEEELIVYDGVRNIYGTYLHGIFDKGEIAAVILNGLMAQKGMGELSEKMEDLAVFRERELDRLAAAVRENLDMERVYGALRPVKFSV